MKLETYAEKHGMELTDYSDLYEASGRGWKFLALHPDPQGCEPAMILVKSPRWPNYQVRDIWSGIPSGQMLTEAQIKHWIRAKAGTLH